MTTPTQSPTSPDLLAEVSALANEARAAASALDAVLAYVALMSGEAYPVQSGVTGEQARDGVLAWAQRAESAKAALDGQMESLLAAVESLGGADEGPKVFDEKDSTLRPATPAEMRARHVWQAGEGARMLAEQAAADRDLYGFNGEGR